MADEIVKSPGRGRPKGTGGNKRPDRKEAMSIQTEPGDNRRYLKHNLKMWDWQKPDMTDPEAVFGRIKEYFQICAEDDMKPGVAGLALAFNVDRKTLWAWANGVDSVYIPPENRNFIKKGVSTFERSDGGLRPKRKGQSRGGDLPHEEPFWLWRH